jgi:hypothetical protein
VDTTEFERSLVADGYAAVPKTMDADTVVTDHSHAWDVRALVTAGQITLTIDTIPTTYKTGDIFTMAAGCIHHEQVGQTGVQYLVGRRDAVDLTEDEAMAIAAEEISASRHARREL